MAFGAVIFCSYSVAFVAVIYLAAKTIDSQKYALLHEYLCE